MQPRQGRTTASSPRTSRSPQRRVDRRDGAVQAHLSLARHRDHRSGADDARLRQLYLSLGDPNPDGSIAVRLYYKPLVLLIWLGAVVMVIGGALSLSDRRLRVGAPKPARGKAAHAAGGVGAPCGGCARLLLRARALLAPVPGLARCSPTRCCPIRRSKRAPARSPRSCAAWSARTSRSTIPTRRSRATCACWCASGCTAGDSDGQVIDFLVARYGEFVLLKPRLVVAHGAAVARRRRSCCSAVRSAFLVARRGARPPRSSATARADRSALSPAEEARAWRRSDAGARTCEPSRPMMRPKLLQIT